MDEDYAALWTPPRVGAEPRSIQAQVDRIMEILAGAPARAGSASGDPSAYATAPQANPAGSWRDTAKDILAQLEREQSAGAAASGFGFGFASPAQAQVAVPTPMPPPIGAPTHPEMGRQLVDFLSSLPAAVQRRIGEAADRARREEGQSFQSYVRDNLVHPLIYSGRTSGFDLPGDNVAARGRRPHPPGIYEDPRLDCSSESYGAIRGREQQLIDYFRSLGLSDNQINGIWFLNPLRGYYLQRAVEECGHIPMPRSRWE